MAEMSPDTEPAVLPPGACIAPGYRVIRLLNRSSFLDVYDVWSEERTCHCVVKTMRPDRRDDGELERDLLREGRLLKRFTHPHLVRVYDVREQPEPIVIFEPLTGPTLTELLSEKTRRLPLAAVAHLGIHLCAAMHYLHRHRMLHLDLKPANIVAVGRIAKVLDLSQARPPGNGVAKWGTHEYMAPEQVCGGRFSPATDVWGIGCVLYEAATGRQAFPTNAPGKYYAQLNSPTPPLTRYRRVPGAFAALVAWCLASDPTARPTVASVMTLLETLAGEQAFLSRNGDEA